MTTHLVERRDAVKHLERELLALLTIARLQGDQGDQGGGVATADGRYQIIKMLGRGASGVVCEARDRRMGRSIALKLYPGLADDGHARAIRDEAQRLGRPQHPNIVVVYDYNAARLLPGELRCFYVAMELLRGLSLRQWLATGPAPVAILRVFCGVGEGLAAAHRAGLVHRDVKPENIVLVDETPKIVDFGLAIDDPRAALALSTGVLSTQDPEGRAIVGTLAYMAPEALEGRADARSDQFSFAAALWEALYRELPYPIESLDPEKRRRITRPGRPERMGPYPKSLQRCLRRALSGDPRRRFGDLEGLVACLQECLAELQGAAASGSAVGGAAAVERRGEPPREEAAVAARSRGWWRSRWSRASRAVAAAGLLGLVGLGVAVLATDVAIGGGSEALDERLQGAARGVVAAVEGFFVQEVVVAEGGGEEPAAGYLGGMGAEEAPARTATRARCDPQGWAGKWEIETTPYWEEPPRPRLHGVYTLEVAAPSSGEGCTLAVTLTKDAIRTAGGKPRPIGHWAKVKGHLDPKTQLLELRGVAPGAEGRPGPYAYDLALARRDNAIIGDFFGRRRDGKQDHRFSGAVAGGRVSTSAPHRKLPCDREFARQLSGEVWRFTATAREATSRDLAPREYQLGLAEPAGCVLTVHQWRDSAWQRVGSGVAYTGGLWRLWVAEKSDDGSLRRELEVGVEVPLRGRFRSIRERPLAAGSLVVEPIPRRAGQDSRRRR